MVPCRWIVALAFVFLIPAANAISLSVNAGNGQARTGAIMTYGGANKDSVTQNLKLQPTTGSLQNYWAFSGPGSTYRYTYGYYGGYAQTGFSVTGSNAYTTYDFYSSSYPYAYQGELLTSTNANSIIANSYASSSGGDQAEVDTSLYDPYGNANLYNYDGYGYGASSYAWAAQTLSSANVASTNGYTLGWQWAYNRYGDDSLLYNWQLGGSVYYLPYNSYQSSAYADSSWTQTENSYEAYCYPYGYTYAYAKPYYYGAISDSKYQSSGTHAMYQWAETYNGYYDAALNYQFF